MDKQAPTQPDDLGAALRGTAIDLFIMEAAIVRLRKLILSGRDPKLRYANIGADALAYELKRAGITPPSRATINRILISAVVKAPTMC